MAENKIIESKPSVFVNPNEFFTVLNDKVGLTSEQVKKICENLNYLYNNLGLADIQVGRVNTIFTEPGALSNAEVYHREAEVDGKTYDYLDFDFYIPSPKIETTLTTELVENENSEMTLETEPILSGSRVVGYKFNFNAKLFNGGNAGSQEVENEFNLSSEKALTNSLITRNIVVRKSGEDLADLYGSQTSIFADMNAVCICTSTFSIFIKGHIYEVYNQTNEAGNVVLVREIGVTDEKIGNTETFKSVAWQEAKNIEPFKYEASVKISQPLTNKTEVSIDNSIVEQAKYGLVIARIVGQDVYLYAVNLPDVDIKIRLEV